MPKINRHHITYNPEWVVEVWARHHREITIVQGWKANEQNRKHLHNFIQSLSHEYNRICLQLYQVESRNINPKRG
jgi:hypothetical protein